MRIKNENAEYFSPKLVEEVPVLLNDTDFEIYCSPEEYLFVCMLSSSLMKYENLYINPMETNFDAFFGKSPQAMREFIFTLKNKGLIKLIQIEDLPDGYFWICLGKNAKNNYFGGDMQ